MSPNFDQYLSIESIHARRTNVHEDESCWTDEETVWGLQEAPNGIGQISPALERAFGHPFTSNEFTSIPFRHQPAARQPVDNPTSNSSRAVGFRQHSSPDSQGSTLCPLYRYLVNPSLVGDRRRASSSRVPHADCTPHSTSLRDVAGRVPINRTYFSGVWNCRQDLRSLCSYRLTGHSCHSRRDATGLLSIPINWTYSVGWHSVEPFLPPRPPNWSYHPGYSWQMPEEISAIVV